MLHELRIYRCMPGRLADLVRRFEQITLPIWEKHGIRQVGFWTVQIGDNNHDFIYLLAWNDLSEREQKWAAFSTDPEWLEARAGTEANGPLVQSVSNQILAPTRFSALQ